MVRCEVSLQRRGREAEEIGMVVFIMPEHHVSFS